MPQSGLQLALLGGKPVGEVQQSPFPVFSARARRRVAQLLEQSKVLAFDRNVPEVREAESALSKYHGGRHVMTLSSGHASLQMALAGLDIADGDEVTPLLIATRRRRRASCTRMPFRFSPTSTEIPG